MRRVLFLLFPLALFADDASEDTAWFTGTLLSSSGLVVQRGHYDFQPYIFMNNNIGYFSNRWHMHRFPETRSSVNLQLYAWFGISKYVDLEIVPQLLYNYEGDTDTWGFGDLTVGLDIQLYTAPNQSLGPAFKLYIYELFPIGKYQGLDAQNLGTDATGGGSFATTIGFVYQQIWALRKPHYISLRVNPYFDVFSPVGVHGINSYGGDRSTRGTVYPGTSFSLVSGVEYNFTKHWAVACDVASIYTRGTRFHGHTIAPVGNRGDAYQFSLAPAIEYNHNANVGLISGIWFSVFGKNTFDFFNAIISINWYI